MNYSRKWWFFGSSNYDHKEIERTEPETPLEVAIADLQLAIGRRLLALIRVLMRRTLHKSYKR